MSSNKFGGQSMTEKKKEAPKRTFTPPGTEVADTRKVVQYCLASKHLDPKNLNFLREIEARNGKGKVLTANQLSGLYKIQKALKHQAAGTYKPGLND